MSTIKTLRIIAIIVSLIGIVLTGYAQGKGIENEYGYTLMITGGIIAALLFLFEKKSS